MFEIPAQSLLGNVVAVNGIELDEDLIVSEVIRKVRQCYEQLETEIRKEDHER